MRNKLYLKLSNLLFYNKNILSKIHYYICRAIKKRNCALHFQPVANAKSLLLCSILCPNIYRFSPYLSLFYNNTSFQIEGLLIPYHVKYYINKLTKNSPWDITPQSITCLMVGQNYKKNTVEYNKLRLHQRIETKNYLQLDGS